MAKKLTTEEFIEKAICVHGYRFDYSLSYYIRSVDKIKIICKEHGEFEQTPNSHLSGSICGKCYGNNRPTLSEFIEKAKIVHGEIYDYSLVNYINNVTKIKIICKIHGEFDQVPSTHLRGCDCPKCGGKEKLNTDLFIVRAIAIHGSKYDYSLVKYETTKIKIKIICKKHGEFEQAPDCHLQGKGCPSCFFKNESLIFHLLKENGILFEHNKDIRKIIPSIKKYYKVDFYLPDKNIIIEYNGGQHYAPVNFSNSPHYKMEESFQKQQKRDEYIRCVCKNNNILLIEIDGREYNGFELKKYIKYNLLLLLN